MAEPFAYGGQTILSHPVFVETILPFLLVFTIVFAVLQKSKILGDGKRQIDALVALAVGLLVISFASATGVIIQLIPFLAVSLVVLLVFYLLVGTLWSMEDLGKQKGIAWALIAVVTLAVTIAVLYTTGAWQYILDIIYGQGVGGSDLLLNIFFVIIIGVAIIAVVWTSKGKDK